MLSEMSPISRSHGTHAVCPSTATPVPGWLLAQEGMISLHPSQVTMTAETQLHSPATPQEPLSTARAKTQALGQMDCSEAVLKPLNLNQPLK